MAVCYLRAGYSPADYPSQVGASLCRHGLSSSSQIPSLRGAVWSLQVEWDGRKLLESCNAFKSPSVAYQLAGTKKVKLFQF